MGKKCIIEFEDKPFHKENGDFLYRVKGFNSLVFDMTGIGKLTPYNSPDLEQVKADAYLKGLNDGQGVILESTQNNAFNNGYKKCLEDMEHDKGKENSIGYKIGYKKGYIDGLNRISDYEDKVRKEAYEKGLSDAWEAARKICTNWVLPDSVLSEIFGMNKTIDDIMKENTASEAIEKIRQYEQEQDRQARIEYDFDEIKDVLETTAKECNVSLDEIAAVLEKMRGEQDG